jgi:hypothetical protein
MEKIMEVVWIKNMKGGLDPQVWHSPVGWFMTMKNSLGNSTFPSYGGDHIVARIPIAPEDERMTFDELTAKYQPSRVHVQNQDQKTGKEATAGTGLEKGHQGS